MTGYESVRSKPSRERVERADRIYKQINAGKSAKADNWSDNLTLNQRYILVHILSLIVGAGFFAVIPNLFNGIPLIGGLLAALISYLLLSKWALKPLSAAAEKARKEINNLNTQIATAVQEQSPVSEDINRNIVRANDNASQAMSGVEVANKAATDLQGQSHHLTDMISRFQQDS